MAKVYDALKRIEKERQRQAVSLGSHADPVVRHGDQPLWKRWFMRRAARPQLPAVSDDRPESIERLAAQLETLKKQVATSVPTPSDVMLLDRVEALASRFDRFEDHMLRAIPSAQELLPPVEAQLARLENHLGARLSEVADRLHERTERLQTRITVLGLVLVFLLVVILFHR